MKRLSMSVVSCLIVLTATIAATSGNAMARTTTHRLAPQWLIRVGSSPVIYVEGTVACRHATCQKLLRTDNNGQSFTDVTTPPTPGFSGTPDGSWDQIVFATALDGFALGTTGDGHGVSTGSVLYATHDGARTWHKQREPVGDFLSSIAVSSSTLYGVTTHCSKQSDGNEGCVNYRLVHTSLSVKHWTSAAIPNGRYFPWNFLGNVAAFGPQVWITEGAKWSLLVSSLDHGTTFSTLTPKWPALASVAGCDLTAFSTTVLWAACPTGMEVSFSLSHDAGATWTTVPTDQFMGTGGGFFDPVSATLAYLDYGGPRPLFRVTDLGHHLTRVGSLRCSSVNSSVNAMVFTTERSGLAICLPQDVSSSARLERTTDGGATWSSIET